MRTCWQIIVWTWRQTASNNAFHFITVGFGVSYVDDDVLITDVCGDTFKEVHVQITI